MQTSLQQHQTEIQGNRACWTKKPLLRDIYAGFYRRIEALIVPGIPGNILEIGSGIGQLKTRFPDAICTDLFPNPWLDAVCDGYELPFQAGTISHLILFDVFHHLEYPGLFLREARRALADNGRLIIFEPYISTTSRIAYGLFHHEPIAWDRAIDETSDQAPSRSYYAAQGNATRVFFRGQAEQLLRGWTIVHAEAFASFSYIFSGGFRKPAFYPRAALALLERLDGTFSSHPELFGARCLVALEPIAVFELLSPSNHSPGAELLCYRRPE